MHKGTYLKKIAYAVFFFLLVLALVAMAYLVPQYIYTFLSHRPVATFVTTTFTDASTTPQERANLSYYVGAHQLDPIFAIQGTDPIKLQQSVDKVLQERDEIANLYTPDQKYSIESSLYPNDFLTDLPTLETARQTLLADPSVVHAKQYHAWLLVAISDYSAGARALANILENSEVPSVGYIGGTSTTTDVVAKLRAVSVAVLAQKQKEQQRYACLESGPQNCPSLASLEQKRNNSLATPYDIPSPPSEVAGIDTLTKQILPLVPDYAGITETMFAINSNCYPWPFTYAREYYSSFPDKMLSQKIVPLNDIYFYDMARQVTLAALPIYEALTKKGVTIQYQNAGNLYECPDSGFDVSSVGSIMGVLEALTNKQSPTDAEKKLLALSLVQKNDLVAYVRSKAAEQTAEGNDITERYIEGSSDFDQVLLGAYRDNHFLITWNQNQSPVVYKFMITSRNFATTMFLMGNPTFLPKPVSLFSTNTPSSLHNLILRTYNSDVSKKYSAEDIVSQAKTSFQLDVTFKLHNN